MGAVTLLALAILVLSLILGVRAGQNQLEARRRQEVGIALQKAVDLRTDGQLEAALAEYRRVLAMDPGNSAAGEGLESLLAIAMGGTPSELVAAPQAGAPNAAVSTGLTPAPAAPLTAPPAAPPATGTASGTGAGTGAAGGNPDSQAMLRPQAVLPSSGTVAPAATGTAASAGVSGGSAGVTVGGDVAMASLPANLPAAVTDQFTRAQTAFRAGRWQQSIDLLTQLRANPATATNTQVAQLLFDAYVNIAGEKDNEDNLESALTLYNKALELQPTDQDVLHEKELISTYLDMQQAYDTDSATAVDLLLQLYILDPQYRDVESRLFNERVVYGDELAIDLDWCNAATQYGAALQMTGMIFPPDLAAKQAQAQATCTNGGTPVALSASAVTTTEASADLSALGFSTPGLATSGLAAPDLATPSGRPSTGRILYSVRDPVDGRNRIWVQPAVGGTATVLAEDGAQPALRADGTRLVYRNVRSGQGGLSASDPATGVFFQITDYPEDVLPSWNSAGSRIVFASNREGDRRWRVYLAWAEEKGSVATLSFGESPAYHPFSDLIVHRGCDATGNGCGLWIMDSTGANRKPLTNVAGDDRPAWSPDGRTVVFTSDGRDGSADIYRVDVATGQVTRLTDSPASDVAPSVDPNGEWVAFFSNRDGAWKLWAVPLAGGAAQLIAPLKGEVGDWGTQGIQWVY